MPKDNMQIAKTILEQMGGTGRLHAFVGANTFVALPDGVMFYFKGSRKVNHVTVKLTADDLYHVTFEHIGSRPMCPVKVVDDADMLYDDMLIPHFETTTGLYLHF